MTKFEGSLQDSIDAQQLAVSAHNDKLDSVLDAQKLAAVANSDKLDSLIKAFTAGAGTSKDATLPAPGQPGAPSPRDPQLDDNEGASKKARLAALITP